MLPSPKRLRSEARRVLHLVAFIELGGSGMGSRYLHPSGRWQVRACPLPQHLVNESLKSAEPC
eukprot:6174401-Prymnesium_polylepis.1